MCICNHTCDEPTEIPFRGLSNRPRLFQWTTIVLLACWVLIVAVAGNNAQVEEREVSLPPLQSFIESF